MEVQVVRQLQGQKELALNSTQDNGKRLKKYLISKRAEQQNKEFLSSHFAQDQDTEDSFLYPKQGQAFQEQRPRVSSKGKLLNYTLIGQPEAFQDSERKRGQRAKTERKGPVAKRSTLTKLLSKAGTKRSVDMGGMRPSTFAIVSDLKQLQNLKKQQENQKEKYREKPFDEFDLDNYLEELQYRSQSLKTQLTSIKTTTGASINPYEDQSAQQQESMYQSKYNSNPYTQQSMKRNLNNEKLVRKFQRHDMTGSHFHNYIHQNREEKVLERHQQVLYQWNKNSQNLKEQLKRQHITQTLICQQDSFREKQEELEKTNIYMNLSQKQNQFLFQLRQYPTYQTRSSYRNHSGSFTKGSLPHQDSQSSHRRNQTQDFSKEVFMVNKQGTDLWAVDSNKQVQREFIRNPFLNQTILPNMKLQSSYLKVLQDRNKSLGRDRKEVYFKTQGDEEEDEVRLHNNDTSSFASIFVQGENKLQKELNFCQRLDPDSRVFLEKPNEKLVFGMNQKGEEEIF